MNGNKKTLGPIANSVSVTLVKQQDVGLGFLVNQSPQKPHVTIFKIIKGGPADESGLLRVGDVILSVNGKNISWMSYQDALQVLRGVPIGGKVLLIIRSTEKFGEPLTLVQTPYRVGRTIRSSNLRNTLPPVTLTDFHDKRKLRIRDKAVRRERRITIKSASAATPLKVAAIPAQKLKERSIIQEEDGLKAEKMYKGFAQEGTAVLKRNLENTSQKIVNANGLDEISSQRSSKKSVPTPAKKHNFAMLKNWESSRQTRDTLYMQACPVNTCTPTHCSGSVMNPSNMTVDPRTFKRTVEEKQKLAKDFIDQYFGSSKRLESELHELRLKEVEQSIKETGSYVLTELELIFGAKTAWRNAPRCIGRIQWNKLQVHDFRHVTTTSEMFESICSHMRYATNKGNIRSCVTFFPPRNNVETEFRVWNPQLIRYAGYEQEDGSILGDPVSVEFTQICVRLGWKPKRGMFDLLPLVLQANGEDPDLYELPADLALEVKLRHPSYEWFEKMELKWYAVPAVSNMLIDIGGVQFPGCPFNGWFMGTEIGRDLTDTARYNMLEPIAKKMGLNTSNSASLWKDKALLEMNVAILHSYQSDRVTIMDHHVATESFMKHLENENKLRGGCPGDWVWLTPPISGSATPIFHQEILNYILNPNCFYQPDPWKYHVWKEPDLTVKTRSKRITFKDLAKSILLTKVIMNKVMEKRIKATILYATETGKSQSYAQQLQEIFNYAFDAKIVCMEDYDFWKLEYETLVLVVTSTFGNGDPPENGESFATNLQKLSKDESYPPKLRKRFDSIQALRPLESRPSISEEIKKRKESIATDTAGTLGNLKFSVFGLGSRAYPNFCAFAHAIDTLLGGMGAERLLEIGEGDELCGQEESFRKWAQTVFKSACEDFCVGVDVNIDDARASLASSGYEKSKYRINVQQSGTNEAERMAGLAKVHRKKVVACNFLERINLQAEESLRSTILIKLENKDGQLSFSPGDHIAVFPRNRPELVKELFTRIQDAPQETAVVQLEVLREIKGMLGDSKSWEADRLPLVSLWNAFSQYLDITSTPTPQLLKLFADCAVNQEDKARLEVLSEGTNEYEEWKFHKIPDLIEVLDEFPSVQVASSLLLSQLPLLQARYYSISSSPSVFPNEIHCTVSVVTYRTQGGEGPMHYGVCSTYLDRIDPGEVVPCFIRHASSFHLPSDKSSSCILVGPGTGIAPFRSFWQQRIHEIKTSSDEFGKMALLFGCRHPDLDHIYKKEVEEAKMQGAITHSFTAFSRFRDVPKTYVQHILQQKIPDFVFDVVYKEKGHFYVCGDVTMAADVRNSLKNILQSKGNLSEGEAEDFINDMRINEYYHEDIFGVTLRTQEVNKSVRSGQIRKKSLQIQ